MATQAVWITTPVESLMVMANDCQDRRFRDEWLDDAFADDRVRTYLPFFLGMQRSGFKEDCLGYTYLADVVNESAAVQGNEIRLGQAQSRSDVKRGIRYSPGMAFGESILSFRSGRESEDNVFGVKAHAQCQEPQLLTSATWKSPCSGTGAHALSSQGLEALNSDTFVATARKRTS